MHHVCQTLHARSRSRINAAGIILVPRAEHRVLNEDARMRRPDEERAYASAVRRWSVMLEWKDGMFVGKLRTVN
jgi:hypothetical protein